MFGGGLYIQGRLSCSSNSAASGAETYWKAMFHAIHTIARKAFLDHHAFPGRYGRAPDNLSAALDESCDLVRHIAEEAPFQIVTGDEWRMDDTTVVLLQRGNGLWHPNFDGRDGPLIHLALLLFNLGPIFLPPHNLLSYWCCRGHDMAVDFEVEATLNLRCYMTEELVRASSMREACGNPGPIDLFSQISPDSKVTYGQLSGVGSGPLHNHAGTLAGQSALDLVSTCTSILLKLSREQTEIPCAACGPADHLLVGHHQSNETSADDNDFDDADVRANVQTTLPTCDGGRPCLAALLALQNQLSLAQRRILFYRDRIASTICLHSTILSPLACRAAEYLLRPLSPSSRLHAPPFPLAS